MSSVYWRQYGFVTNEGVFVGEKPNNEFIINPMFKVVDCKTWNKFNSLFQCNMFLAWHTCHDYGVHWLVVVCNKKKRMLCFYYVVAQVWTVNNIFIKNKQYNKPYKEEFCVIPIMISHYILCSVGMKKKVLTWKLFSFNRFTL